jgi:3D (Asp-Asp-Asp) domain-containing protein
MKKFTQLTLLLTILTISAYNGTSDTASPYVATAYVLRGITASGERVREGIIAADPKVLPLGTVVEIRGMGRYVVKDTGRLIKGRRIDIWMPLRRDAIQFGRRTVYLTVVSMPKRNAIRRNKKTNRTAKPEVQNPEGGTAPETEAQR